MSLVERIHIAESTGAPMRSLAQVEVVVGVGLIGDRYANHTGHWTDSDVGREITLVEVEALEFLAADHGIHMEPGETRRNITTRGINLNELVAKQFLIGDVLAEGTELCEPCQYLTDLVGKPILRPLVHRGGLRAMLITGGVIRVGDRVQLADEQASIAQ